VYNLKKQGDIKMAKCLVCERGCDDTSFRTNGNRICSKECGKRLFQLDLFWINYYTNNFDLVLVEEDTKIVRSLLSEMKRIAAYLGE
jgi:hypothetical protein